MRRPLGCVAAIVAAHRSELQTIEGIGKDLADRIKWMVIEKIEFYESPKANL